MVKDKTVMRSIEAPGGQRCVDLFKRPDGSWGFEEYRRDPEDGSGWQTIGFHEGRIFADCKEARAAAHVSVSWLPQFDP